MDPGFCSVKCYAGGSLKGKGFTQQEEREKVIQNVPFKVGPHQNMSVETRPHPTTSLRKPHGRV